LGGELAAILLMQVCDFVKHLLVEHVFLVDLTSVQSFVETGEREITEVSFSRAPSGHSLEHAASEHV